MSYENNFMDEGRDTIEAQRKMQEYIDFSTPSDIAEQHYIDSGQAQKDQEWEQKRMEEGENYAKMYCSVMALQKEREKLLSAGKKMRQLSPEEQDFLFQKIEDLEEGYLENSDDTENNEIKFESDIKPEDLPF